MGIGKRSKKSFVRCENTQQMKGITARKGQVLKGELGIFTGKQKKTESPRNTLKDRPCVKRWGSQPEGERKKKDIGAAGPWMKDPPNFDERKR